jgi:hypothetical protein
MGYAHSGSQNRGNEMSDVTCTAKWVSDQDMYNEGELVATKDDILEVHGKHVSDGEFVLRGPRNGIYFWAKPEYIELLGDLPDHMKDQPLI